MDHINGFASKKIIMSPYQTITSVTQNSRNKNEKKLKSGLVTKFDDKHSFFLSDLAPANET